MDYKTFLTACTLDHKMDLIDKAIEYMETVPVSTECYNAIVDMLKYDKEGITEDFRKLTCESCIENYKRAQSGSQGKPGVGSLKHNNIDFSKIGSTKAPENTRDDFQIVC